MNRQSWSSLKKWSLRILGFILMLICICLLIIWYYSPGETRPMTDKDGKLIPNSIAIIEKPILEGIPQSLIIRGENVENPILLFLHGGPGTPEFPFIKETFRDLESVFTICYWDQRGAGKSYTDKSETITLEQLVKDGGAVSQYLIEKFDQPKIYILGHSWGSFLGSFMVNKYPNLFHAYLGTGQVANQYDSEVLSYQFTANEAAARFDEAAIEIIKNTPLPDINDETEIWFNYMQVNRKYVGMYGGATYEPQPISDIIKAYLFCEEYTFSDKINTIKGAIESFKLLWKPVMEYNLIEDLKEQPVPVYIFQGKHDYQTTYRYAKEYYDSLKAPIKQFYPFEKSAHTPMIEEYDIFKQIIQDDILK